MKKLWLPLMLLAGCSGGGDQGGNANQSAATGPSDQGKAPSAGASGSISGLTGLYEGGGAPPHQLCIVESGETARFGLVVWGSNLHSCSGSGSVSRAGDTLSLRMAGDSACAIEARVSGKTITLPEQVPQGCAYYCGARASLGGASLTQRGATAADAAKAKDLVGDPLCTEG